MKSFVVAIMLLSFLMGSGYTIPGHSSKKCDEHPWEEVLHKSARVSQDKCGEDPWSDLNKSRALQKKYRAVEWTEVCE